ncbi:MAG: site-specific DNA-methyltransferase [Tepidisphaera sp.]|nr:site-specific DNA-methyltransferase [Tepidisphaera sp.]
MHSRKSRQTRNIRARCRSLDNPGKALPRHAVWTGDCHELLRLLPKATKFDLVVASPPYNLGKEYESRASFKKYLRMQADLIEELVPRVKMNGSLCWQVGNYVENGFIEPLDIHLHPLFSEHGLILRNRIIWRFGHGLHCKRRFSGRYEVVLWYTRSENYVFNLDSVRIPSKYPGKRNSRGVYTGHPSGRKNPEDVWDIPNVVGNHREKTIHPCQFPVGLIERLILALTNARGLVFDPFCGVGSAGVAAAIHARRFLGAECVRSYAAIARRRISAALCGEADYRPHDQPIYDHRKSKLSVLPHSRAATVTRSR